MQPPAPTVEVLVRLDEETDCSMDASSASSLNKQNYLDMLLKLTRLSVVESSKHMPVVLPALAKLMPAISSANAITVMKYVVLWAYLSSGHEGALNALRSFHDAVLPSFNRRPDPMLAA